MQNEISVTKWIEAVRKGDEASAHELWQRYFSRLMAVARSKMGALPRSTYDEEDAAISTFRVLCEKLRSGQYPELSGRDELWRLMLVVVVHKIGRRAEYEFAQKRVGKFVAQNRVDESLIELKDVGDVGVEYEYLLSKLNDPVLERVAVLKLDGFTNEEIGTVINRTRRTVQRMIDLIRESWSEELDARE